MTDFKYNKVLLALIGVGLIAALIIGWQRNIIEQHSMQVELVMEYEDIVELAQMEGVGVDGLMSQSKQAGITTLAVYETTLEKMNNSGKVTALPGAQILHQYRSGSLVDGDWLALAQKGLIRAEDVYIICRDAGVLNEVKDDLTRRLGAERVTVAKVGTSSVIIAKANFEKVVKWNLGLPTDEMKYAADNGFYVMARPSNYTKVTTDDIKAVFDRISAVPNVSGIMFVGEEALGYPNLLPETVKYMKERQLTLAMIEHPLQLQFVKQEGLTALAAANNYQAARVYVIPKDEQPKLKLAEAIQRWEVTDQERNIRINLLRKYDKPELGKTLIETNLEYIKGVKEALLANGFTIGRAGTFQPYFPEGWLLALIAVGATAAGVLYLTLLRPFGVLYQYLLLAVISSILVFPLLTGAGTQVRQAVALASAVIFPVLAMTWQLDRWRSKPPAHGAPLLRIITDGVVSLVLTVLLAMVGGFYLGAILGDVRFFLEMEIFRGVKLTFVAPLILITMTYLARFNLFAEGQEQKRNIWQQFIAVLDYPVYIKSLFILAVGAVAAWVYIGRSGHTAGVPVPGIELKLRAYFEQVMYARPRSKEFLIAHPAFLLAVMAVYRQWPRLVHFGLVIVATIGQGSLVETFAHLRTPILMSAIRGFDGMILGAAIGVLAVLAVQCLHYLSYLLGRRIAGNE